MTFEFQQINCPPKMAGSVLAGKTIKEEKE
jgi:hypothetical protein